MAISEFSKARSKYIPRSPEVLKKLHSASLDNSPEHDVQDLFDTDVRISQMFPQTASQPLLRLVANPAAVNTSNLIPNIRVGVVFSGGQAPGGHNVVAGLFDGLCQISRDPFLIGFTGGPAGILRDHNLILTREILDRCRNTGGFDLLGTGRTKLESEGDFAACAEIFSRHDLDAFVIIGGDDSNTNAAFLAEYLLARSHKTKVIGVPKTIDSDLRGPFTETSFGFDTAVRVYSELIANIAKDAASGRKYWHFIRLMGRSASHITLEAALQTHPNVALISEEIAKSGKTLRQIVEDLADVISSRASLGKQHGVVLVPEGLIEFVPEMKVLIAELNDVIAQHREYMESLRGFTAQIEYLTTKLTRENAGTLASLPLDIQRQLLMDRDPHGNVALSRIETEKLLIELLAIQLGEMRTEGKYSGKFAWQTHFLGYEGRCAAPTNFDADYAWCLGLTAASLAYHLGGTAFSGYLAAVHGLAHPVHKWQAWGVPLVSMLTLERRNGNDRAVIRKTLVDLEGQAFRKFDSARIAWTMSDEYKFAGPIQYFGPPELVDRIPVSLT
jgi:pyrophosphate--fructose-6-phosphate 1-phosphotransferase